MEQEMNNLPEQVEVVDIQFRPGQKIYYFDPDGVSYQTGDHVIIVNAAKVRMTGRKLDQKMYRHHTGYPGGLKETSYRHLLEEKPEFAVYESIRRMMPKGPLGRQMLKKLRVYAGPEHNNAAQKPETLVLK